MANIYFIRQYKFCGTDYVDIGYTKDGYITRVNCMEADKMPKTARKWLSGKCGKMQYDKIFKREEIVFMERR